MSVKALAAFEHTLSLHHELARKIIHVLFGVSFLVTVAMFGLEVIPSVATVSLALFLIVRRYHIFAVMHQVHRRTYGELFYPLGLLAASLMLQSAQAFFVCVAVLAFGDSLASLAGKWWRSPSILIGSSKASLLGSTTFFTVTMLVFAVSSQVGLIEVWWGILALSAVTLTAVEAGSPVGSDNFFIPVVLALILQINGY